MNVTTISHVAPTTEIMGAVLLNYLDETAIKQFRADPQATLMSSLNFDVSDALHISFADNNADTVHLTLPYYDSIDAAKTEKLSDMNMEEVAGGEIIISTIIGAIIGGAVTAGLGVGFAAGAGSGAIIGAVVGTAVAATAVAVGVPAGLMVEGQGYEAGLAASRASRGIVAPTPTNPGGK